MIKAVLTYRLFRCKIMTTITITLAYSHDAGVCEKTLLLRKPLPHSPAARKDLNGNYKHHWPLQDAVPEKASSNYQEAKVYDPFAHDGPWRPMTGWVHTWIEQSIFMGGKLIILISMKHVLLKIPERSLVPPCLWLYACGATLATIHIHIYIYIYIYVYIYMCIYIYIYILFSHYITSYQ